MKLNLQEQVINIMLSDNDFKSGDQEERIKTAFKNATKKEKDVIDTIFICLTGYSLTTILYKPEEIII